MKRMMQEFPACYKQIWFFCVGNPPPMDVSSSSHDIRQLQNVIMPSQPQLPPTTTPSASSPKQQKAVTPPAGDVLSLSPGEQVLQEMESQGASSSDESSTTASTSTASPAEAMVTSPAPPKPSILKRTPSRQHQLPAPSQTTGGARRKVYVQDPSSKQRNTASYSSMSKSFHPPPRRHSNWNLSDEERHQQSLRQFQPPQHRRRQESPESRPSFRHQKHHHSREHSRRRQSPSPERRHQSSGRWYSQFNDEEIHDRTRSLSQVRLGEEMATFEANRDEFMALDLSSHVGREMVKSGASARPQFKVDSFDQRLRADRAAQHEIAPDARDDHGDPSRPYLDDAPMLYHGHVVRRIRPASVMKMRCGSTGQNVWIPTALVKDTLLQLNNLLVHMTIVFHVFVIPRPLTSTLILCALILPAKTLMNNKTLLDVCSSYLSHPKQQETIIGDF